MTSPLHHPGEPSSNEARDGAAATEPRALRTFTPSQAVLARRADVFHWTPEGRRLYDFTSGVLVANLGHNPGAWMQRFVRHMGWPLEMRGAECGVRNAAEDGSDTPHSALRTPQFFSALPMT